MTGPIRDCGPHRFAMLARHRRCLLLIEIARLKAQIGNRHRKRKVLLGARIGGAA